MSAKQQPKPRAKRWFVVMRAHEWSTLSFLGMPMQAAPNGPHRFLPIFNTREEAIAHENGSAEYVREIETVRVPRRALQRGEGK